MWCSVKAGFRMIATIATIAAIARKKRSAIVASAIMRKPLFSDRSDHSYLMETSLYGNRLAIKVATIAQGFFVAIVAILAII